MLLPKVNYLLYVTLFICPTFAEIAILGKGIGFIEEDDIAIIFYVTVKNVCKDDLELSVNMIQCCENLSNDEVDCDSMTLIGGDMGTLPSRSVKKLTLIYPNIYLFDRRGVCTVEVTFRNQFKKKEITTDIHFDTTRSCAKKDNKSQCETSDLDPTQNCNPVDCLIKYSGTISYFNPECKRCQPVPVCNCKTDGEYPDVAYSPYTNECQDVNVPITKEDLEDIERGNIDNNQTRSINAICHYGKVTENGQCVCYDGWTTSTSDEGVYQPGVAQRHLCNIQIGDWNCVNKKRMRVTAIVMIIFSLTVISKVLLLMCLMTWCYKHFRKADDIKICDEDPHPDDPSMVICHDMGSFDKCLCREIDEEQVEDVQEDPQDQPRVLEAQTVNVSYYAGSPSLVSSYQTSTTSGESSKTEPSISLSKTTSSAPISFPEGDSSRNTQNSSQSNYIGDETSNKIAYGVYCDMGDEDSDEVDSEEEDERHGSEESEEETRSLNLTN